MADTLRYDPSAARKLLMSGSWREIESPLLQARDEVRRDLELLASGDIPKEKQPLDAGFIELPHNLLREYAATKENSLLGKIDRAATVLREQVDNVVLLGIGGSYMGARALFEALCHPYHNELDLEQRRGVPRLYFEGYNLDNDFASGLLDLLQQRCKTKHDFRQCWGLIVISKSGGTLETAVAFRLFRKAMEDFYGADSPEVRRYTIPITGEEGKLRKLSKDAKYEHIFPIPDDVGGRFSVFTAVGLVPAAVLGLNIYRLLEGAADMTDRFFQQPFGDNPVLDYVAVGHLFEREQGMTTRVLSTWGNRLEAIGLWYDQLLAESLGKEERGALPLTVVNTRDLHSRGQQHQEGKRDKLITNLCVEQLASKPLAVPLVPAASDQDQLNRLEGRTLPQLLTAAIQGTNQAYADDRRPTADIILPVLDEYTLGQLLQMFMLATVLEGRLIGINPYGQPGVEAYKRNTMRILGGK